MTRATEPFESQHLRSDIASPEATERVWARLHDEIDVPRVASVRPAGVLWGTVLASVAFTVGVWVGNGNDGPVAETRVALLAEPNIGARSSGGRTPTLPSEARQLDATEPRTERALPPVRASHERRVRADTPEVEALPEPQPTTSTPPVSSATEVSDFPPWQRMANGGEYEAALFELGQSGGFEQTLSKASAEQLMLLVDVARATGQRQRALAALRRVVSQFPTQPVAPLAAWSLGNLLEKSGDTQGAAEAFAAYRSLFPKGDFAEDALVRQLRSAVNQSDRERASRLLAQYETEFPEARRAEEVSSLREQLAGSGSAFADAGPPQEPQQVPVPIEQSSPATSD